MSKKTFYIILIVLAGLIIIGGLIWYFIFKPSAPATSPEAAGFTTPSEKTLKGRTPISEGPVISAHFSGDSILFYDFSGQLWQFNQGESKPVLLDEKPIENLAEIIWPKVFSPDGKKIIYQKNNSLLTGDSNGKNQRTLISDLKLKDIILKWPNTNNIAIISKPSGAAAGSLWFLDVRNLNISKIIDNFFGLETLFSPDGSSFIYSYTNENGRDLKLEVYDKKGNSKIINNVSTLVDKCIWAKDLINIYCAIPKSWPDFAILPDDYYKNAFSTSDDVWKINTETSEKTLIAKDIGGISNLIVSEDENNLFFILRENQFLYKLIIN